jgi:hypothetical protein
MLPLEWVLRVTRPRVRAAVAAAAAARMDTTFPLLTFFLRPFAVLPFGSLALFLTLRAFGLASLALFACLLGAPLGGFARLRRLLLHRLRLASLLGIAIGRLHLLLLLLHALRRRAVLVAGSRALFSLFALGRLSSFGL